MYFKVGKQKIALLSLSVAGIILACIFLLEEISFSRESGFYETPFLLEIQANPGTKIYYTLDGSEPTTDSELYVDGIWIDDRSQSPNSYSEIYGITSVGHFFPEELVDKGTVVKVLAVYGGIKSKYYTETYFVGFQNKTGYDDVMVMAMTVKNEDFFSEDTGIYMRGTMYDEWMAVSDSTELFPELRPANYNQRSREWEREVNVKLWDMAGVKTADYDIGVRIRGGWSRAYRQKGFNFYSREIYGNDDYGLSGYMLRTSGSRDSGMTMLRDVFNQSLVSDREVAWQSAQPCVLFINGEYWGVYNLQDRYTDVYFKNRYGINPDNLIVVKNEERVSEGEDADIELYLELLRFAQENDLASHENYAQICEMMDVQSFIDYYVFECYVANADWPQNNVCTFRSRKVSDGKYNDGRWRWGLYDTDESTNGLSGEGVLGRPDSDPFSKEAHWSISPMEDTLFSNLIENTEFKQLFVETFEEMTRVNFNYERVHKQLYELAEIYAEPVTKTQHRFNYTADEYTEEDFWEYIAEIDEFYKQRPEYVLDYLYQAMGMTENVISE